MVPRSGSPTWGSNCIPRTPQIEDHGQSPWLESKETTEKKSVAIGDIGNGRLHSKRLPEKYQALLLLPPNCHPLLYPGGPP